MRHKQRPIKSSRHKSVTSLNDRPQTSFEHNNVRHMNDVMRLAFLENNDITPETWKDIDFNSLSTASILKRNIQQQLQQQLLDQQLQVKQQQQQQELFQQQLLQQQQHLFQQQNLFTHQHDDRDDDGLNYDDDVGDNDDVDDEGAMVVPHHHHHHHRRQNNVVDHIDPQVDNYVYNGSVSNNNGSYELSDSRIFATAMPTTSFTRNAITSTPMAAHQASAKGYITAASQRLTAQSAGGHLSKPSVSSPVNSSQVSSMIGEFLCDEPDCGKTFPSLRKLRHHKVVHSDEFPFVCQFKGCDKRFKRKFGIDLHSTTHFDLDPEMYSKTSNNSSLPFFGRRMQYSMCKPCGEKFKTVLDYQHHMLNHGKEPFKCPVKGCGQTFSIWKSFQKHRASHYFNYYCKMDPRCQHFTSNLQLLKLHIYCCHFQRKLPASANNGNSLPEADEATPSTKMARLSGGSNAGSQLQRLPETQHSKTSPKVLSGRARASTFSASRATNNTQLKSSEKDSKSPMKVLPKRNVRRLSMSLIATEEESTEDDDECSELGSTRNSSMGNNGVDNGDGTCDDQNPFVHQHDDGLEHDDVEGNVDDDDEVDMDGLVDHRDNDADDHMDLQDDDYVYDGSVNNNSSYELTDNKISAVAVPTTSFTRNAITSTPMAAHQDSAKAASRRHVERAVRAGGHLAVPNVSSPASSSQVSMMGEFLCDEPDCGKTFPSLRKLRHHKVVHSDEFPFVCQFKGCDKRFKRKFGIDLHSTTHFDLDPEMYSKTSNNSSLPFFGRRMQYSMCKPCGEKFKTVLDYQRHMLNHGKEPFKCPVKGCGQTFSIWKSFQKHRASHYFNYYCKMDPRCQHFTSNLQLLKLHIYCCHFQRKLPASANNGNSLPEADEATPSPKKARLSGGSNAGSQLQRSPETPQTKTPLRVLPRRACASTFSASKTTNNTQLKSSEKDSKLPLKVLPKRSARRLPMSLIATEEESTEDDESSELGSTRNSSMGNNGVDSNGDTCDGGFKCHLCDYKFSVRFQLTKHLSTHLELSPDMYSASADAKVIQISERRRREFECNKCKIRFLNMSDLDTHMRKHGQRPYVCTFCQVPSSFKMAKQYLSHLYEHRFNYRCTMDPQCDFTINRKDALKLHIFRMHMNQKLPAYIENFANMVDCNE